MKTNQNLCQKCNYKICLCPFPFHQRTGGCFSSWKLIFHFPLVSDFVPVWFRGPPEFSSNLWLRARFTLWSTVIKVWGGSLGTEFILCDGLSSGVVERVEYIWVLIPGLLLSLWVWARHLVFLSLCFLCCKKVFEMGIIMLASPKGDCEN